MIEKTSHLSVVLDYEERLMTKVWRPHVRRLTTVRDAEVRQLLGVTKVQVQE